MTEVNTLPPSLAEVPESPFGDEVLERLAGQLGLLVFYDTPQMSIDAVRLAKAMLDLANVQMQVQLRTRQAPAAVAPSPPAPERRKRGPRGPRKRAATNGAQSPAAQEPESPPLFPEQPS